ncbi:MAG: hemolysin family protein [Candidatus Omnitrophota bacterium]|jgi:CBS domain containing-hemolysin-like protein
MDRFFYLLGTGLVLFCLALLSAFFSASETSVIGLSKIRLRHMLSKEPKKAQYIQDLVVKLDKFIVAILLGNNFVNISISAILTVATVKIFGDQYGVLVSTLSATFFVLVFCEIIPKTLAIKHTEKIAMFSAPLMGVYIRFFNPLIAFFGNFSAIVLKLMRVPPAKRSPLITEEELRLMIEMGKEEGVLTDEERKMLHRIFEFGDTRLSEVMVPKDKMVAISSGSGQEELLATFVEEGHQRLPVYQGTRENIVGIIYSHDLLYILRDRPLVVVQDLIRKPYCVPPGMKVNELLRKFQADKIQIAIVIDEKSRALGLVTLEDLLEEIVGEIEEQPLMHNREKRS